MNEKAKAYWTWMGNKVISVQKILSITFKVKKKDHSTFNYQLQSNAVQNK